MKIDKIILNVIMILLISFNSISALTLMVGKGNAYMNQTVQIPITVNIPNGIAGASFTLIYDSSVITLTDVQSTFFDTFLNQWNTIDPIPDFLPPISVELDGATYTQPLMKNETTAGHMISAARCTPADDSSNVLFTLSFTLKDGASPGVYSVGVTQNIIDNTAAGYDEAGETIPVLIGADLSKDVSDPLAFPILLEPSNPGVGGTLEAGSVTFTIIAGTDTDEDGILDDGDNSGLIDNFCTDGVTTNCDDNCTTVSNADQTDTDSDKFGNVCDDDDDDDGITDEWEKLYAGLNPLVYDSDGDLDNDGYTNYEEFILGSDPSDKNDPHPKAMPWILLLLE